MMIESVMTEERPILFSAPMVRAIREKRKTQTRRVINPQPYCSSARILGPAMYAPVVINSAGEMEPGPEIYGVYDEYGEWGIRCPYGRPGDRLWVKETFVDIGRPDRLPEYVYKADILGPGFEDSERARKDLGYKWTPSIFMPRGASRLTLDILDIRVQRIQEISTSDIIKEGVLPDESYLGSANRYRHAWIDLWDSINAKLRPRYTTQDGKKAVSHYESFPWEDIRETREYRGKPWYVYGNPWVWAVSFSEVAG